MKPRGALQTKRSVLVLSVWLVSLIAAVCVRITAQSQDPLQERLYFLKTKLENHLSYSVQERDTGVGNVRFEPLKFESCRIAWRSSTEFGKGADIPPALSDVRIVNQVSVDLSSIDPARIKISVVEKMVERSLPRSLVLELKIRPGAPGFRNEVTTGNGDRVTRATLEEKSYAFFFNRNDQSVAEEISKAFSDASNICRARVKRPK